MHGKMRNDSKLQTKCNDNGSYPYNIRLSIYFVNCRVDKSNWEYTIFALEPRLPLNVPTLTFVIIDPYWEN